MYGSVARFTVKPGRVDELISVMEEFDRDRKPRIKGFRGSWVYRLDADANTLMLAVGFEDKAAYMANADDPEQDKWFQRMAEHMAGEPEWNDGEIIYVGNP